MKSSGTLAIAVLLLATGARAQELGTLPLPRLGDLPAPKDPIIGTGDDYLRRAEAARRIRDCRRAYLSFEARNRLRPSERLRLMQECFAHAAAGEEAAVAGNPR